MKKHLILLLLSFSLAAPIQAAAQFFQLADVGSSAEMIGKGNVTGFSHSANGIFDNPASLYRVQDMSLSLFTTTFMEEYHYFNGAYAAKTSLGTVGIGVYSQAVSDLYDTYETSDTRIHIQSTFKYQNLLVKAGHAFSPLSNLHLGSSILYYSNGFTVGNYKSKGYNVEVGGILDLNPLELSATATNLFTGLDAQYESGGSENLAAQLTFSGRYDLGAAEILGQVRRVEYMPGFLKSAAVGVPLFSDLLHVSAGYKEFFVLTNIQKTVTLGLGLHVSGVDFDYAYERSDNPFFNHKHYFSMNLAFGKN